MRRAVRRWGPAAVAAMVVAAGGPPLARAAHVPAAPKVIDGQIADWTGTSPMVGGVSTVDDGEFIYQDYIYDDTGASAAPQTANAGRGTTGGTEGTYRYPTDTARYAANAADIFQVRAALDGDQVRFLVVLNTMRAPDAAIVGLALGGSSAARHSWPGGAGIATPGTEHVLELWGTGGALDAAPLASVGGAVAVDTETNAIEASVPAALVGTTFRLYAAAGLHDGNGGWVPVATARSATLPGGGDGRHPALWNVAFRPQERAAHAGPGWNDDNFWFERAQAIALTDGNIDEFFADVDLHAPDQAAPRIRGFQQRIYPSAATVGPYHEGFIETGLNTNNGDTLGAGRGRGCSLLTLPLPSCAAFSLAGPWQPSAMYIPDLGDAEPERMVVLLHGGTYPWNFAARPNVQRLLGDELRAVIVEPFALGPGGWYIDQSQLSVLEAMDDAAAWFPSIDPTKTTVGGISMGGFGANRLLVTHPDRFAGGFLWSAAPGDPTHDIGGSRYDEPAEPGHGNPVDLLENNRNHDLLIIHGVPDQSAYYAIMAAQVARLERLGYRYQLMSHLTWNHTTIVDVDSWGREQQFVAAQHLDPNPPHVTFSMSEAWWRPDLSPRLVFDRAYWVEGLRVRDTSQGLRSIGTVDAVTYGLGGHEPVIEPFGPTLHEQPAPYLYSGRGQVGVGPAIGPANRLDLTLTNVRAVTIDGGRAGLTFDEPLTLDITSDGGAEVTVRIGDAAKAATVAAGTQEVGL